MAVDNTADRLIVSFNSFTFQKRHFLDLTQTGHPIVAIHDTDHNFIETDLFVVQLKDLRQYVVLYDSNKVKTCDLNTGDEI
jgi:hypothetical protein